MTADDENAAEVHGLDPWGLNQVEKLLRGLTGVKSLKLVPNGHGGIEEVHVVSTSEIGAKQVVRNIESALLAEFGLQIDHRKISVARVEAPDIHPQLEEAAPAEESPAAEDLPDEEPGDLEEMEPLGGTGVQRLLLEALEIERRAGKEIACRVVLRHDEAEYEGQAQGPDFPKSRLEVAAQAVLQALDDATVDTIDLSLEDATPVEVPGRQLVVVVVQGQENRRTTTLPGVSLVDDSPEEAAVRACLQATNRWAAAT